ncbi:MAG: glycosyltransferase family 39 protein [Chloroflexota bacterium]
MKKYFQIGQRGLADYHYCLLFLLLAAALYALVFSLNFDGLRSPDQMDYAQIARHLYAGDGFETSYITPLSFAFNDSINNHPNLWRPPLYPLIVAAAFHIFGVNDAAVTIVSGFFYVALIPLVYLFGKEIFNRKVGLWAGAISLASVVLVNLGMQGLTETMFTFFFILTLYLLYRRTNPLLVGFVLGLCYLTRYNVLFLLPGVLWFMYKEYTNQVRCFLELAAIFLVTVSPWLIRNFIVTGNPLFTLQTYEIAMFNDIHPGYFLYGAFQPVEPLRFVISYPFVVLKKMVSGAADFFVEIPRMMFNFFVPATALAAIFDLKELSKDKRIVNLLVSAGLMILLQAVILSATHAIVRLFVPFVPIVIIFASYKITDITNAPQTKAVRNAVTCLFIILIIVANTAGVFLFNYSGADYVHPDEINYIQATVNTDGAVVTDVPWMVAWHCERTGIWFPLTYESMKSRLPDVQYLYFSPDLKNNPREDNINEEYLDNPAFRQQFKLVKSFDSGALLFEKSQ